MPTARELLQRLQYTVSQTNDRGYDAASTRRVYFAETYGQLYVEFYGSPFDETYDALLQTICTAEVAGCLRSLALLGPDEGANGTRNWDLTYIVESGKTFPQMTAFFVEPTALEHHNQSIIGRVYDEEGQIGQMLTRMPVLRSLTVPSAPDVSFFQTRSSPLQFLQVDTGYAHQDFLLNLSRSSCFPELMLLDFGDYNLRNRGDYHAMCSPFEHYEQLFCSNAFEGVRRFNLRNSALSPEQLAYLHSLLPTLQFYVIQAYGDYVRG